MISFLDALTAGNAVRVLVAPPAGAKAWKVLRKTTSTFTGHDDVGASVICESPDTAAIDTAALQNGTPYYYRSYDQAADNTWSTEDTGILSATPATTATRIGPDPLIFIHERLELGLKAACDAGKLRHESNYIPTFRAPPTYEDVVFPIVTMHLANDEFRGGASGLGEVIADDVYDAVGEEWIESEGALSRFQLTIVAWAVGNADVRDALRLAIADVLMANLPIFAAKGFLDMAWSQVNAEDFETYTSPMYQVVTTLNGVAPAAVTARSAPIAGVDVTPIAIAA